MELLQDLNRDYRRYSHSPRERTYLGLNGLQHIQSSNVSSVGVKGESLIIRFHNGSMYEYPNQASQYENMLKSNSKGKWVWRNLRRKNVLYRKIGVLPLPDDIGVTDEEIFQEIDNRYMADLTRHVDVPVFQSFEFIKGINYQKIQVGNINVYKAITQPLPLTPTQPITVTPSQALKPIEQIEWKQPSKISLSPKKTENINVWQKDFDKSIENTELTPVREKVLKLYKNFGEIYTDLDVDFTSGRAYYTRVGNKIVVNDVTSGENKRNLVTYTHEIGHALDNSLGKLATGKNNAYLSQLGNYDYETPSNPNILKASKNFTDAISKYKLGYGERFNTWEKEFKIEEKQTYKYFNYQKEKQKEVNEANKHILEIPRNKLDEQTKVVIDLSNKVNDKTLDIAVRNQYEEQLKKELLIYNQIKQEVSISVKEYNNLTSPKNFMQGKEHYSQVGDFYDALSNGTYFEKNITSYGHGKDYFKDTGAKEVEIFTHLSTLSVYDPQIYNELKQDFPEIVTAYENMIDEATKLSGVDIT